MIGATVGMAAMAVLFVVFGMFALGDGEGCDGHCGGCSRSCEFDKSGREA